MLSAAGILNYSPSGPKSKTAPVTSPVASGEVLCMLDGDDGASVERPGRDDQGHGDIVQSRIVDHGSACLIYCELLLRRIRLNGNVRLLGIARVVSRRFGVRARVTEAGAHQCENRSTQYDGKNSPRFSHRNLLCSLSERGSVHAETNRTGNDGLNYFFHRTSPAYHQGKKYSDKRHRSGPMNNTANSANPDADVRTFRSVELSKLIT